MKRMTYLERISDLDYWWDVFAIHLNSRVVLPVTKRGYRKREMVNKKVDYRIDIEISSGVIQDGRSSKKRYSRTVARESFEVPRDAEPQVQLLIEW